MQDEAVGDNNVVDDDVDLSSAGSSPSLSAVPFHPRFRVTVPDAIKNGEVLEFTIKVYKVFTTF